MPILPFIVSIFSIGAMVLGTGAVSGQGYPIKPIRVVTAAIGGGSDFTTRLIAQAISGPLGQPLIVDNRPPGVIQGVIISNAPPDGYTLLVSGSSVFTFPLLQKAPYDPVKDFSPITVTSAEPSALAPGLPTVAATGLPGYQMEGITAIFAPARTPEAIINRLNQEIVRFLRTPKAKEQLLNVGAEVVASSPAELAATLKSEMAKMSKVIKEAGIRVD